MAIDFTTCQALKAAGGGFCSSDRGFAGKGCLLEKGVRPNPPNPLWLRDWVLMMLDDSCNQYNTSRHQIWKMSKLPLLRYCVYKMFRLWPPQKNNRLLAPNIVHQHMKYERCLSFPFWDTVFTSKALHTDTHTCTLTWMQRLWNSLKSKMRVNDVIYFISGSFHKLVVNIFLTILVSQISTEPSRLITYVFENN